MSTARRCSQLTAAAGEPRGVAFGLAMSDRPHGVAFGLAWPGAPRGVAFGLAESGMRAGNWCSKGDGIGVHPFEYSVC